MAHIFVLNNVLLPSWEAELPGIQIRKLRDQDFYSLEDLEDRPANVNDLRGQVCLYDEGGLGYHSTEIEREWILFSLALCSSEGVPSIPLIIGTSKGRVTSASVFERITTPTSLRLYQGISVNFFIQILVCLKEAYRKSPDKLEITVYRYNRYVMNRNSPDALLDLSICLESLFSATTEIRFRFSLGLVKLLGYSDKKSLQYFELFKDLYDLRSSYVHGDPKYKKAYKKLAPHFRLLRDSSRKALGLYILYLKENKPHTWANYLTEKLVS